MIDHKQELILESRLENMTQVERFVEGISDFYNINHNYFGNLLVSVTEAFKNAVIHGNQLNPEKKVTLTFTPAAFGLTFSVEDEGTGFDYHAVPDPTDPALPEEEQHARGIYLIRKLSDQVVFKDPGNRVQIDFHIASINYELSVNRAKMLNQYFNESVLKTQKSEH